MSRWSYVALTAAVSGVAMAAVWGWGGASAHERLNRVWLLMLALCMAGYAAVLFPRGGGKRLIVKRGRLLEASGLLALAALAFAVQAMGCRSVPRGREAGQNQFRAVVEGQGSGANSALMHPAPMKRKSTVQTATKEAAPQAYGPGSGPVMGQRTGDNAGLATFGRVCVLRH